MVLATDPAFGSSANGGPGFGGTTPWMTTYNTGDGGNFDWFSRDGQLMFLNTDGGNSAILYIDTVKFKAYQCSPSSAVSTTLEFALALPIPPT